MSVLPLARDDDDLAARVKLKKAPTAFRTISEVADDLHIPQHVLRFWETKFSQVKPLKRGGGRRYYRPDDITLLRRISHLLYTQGYTIKGVQRLLREGGGRLADDIPPPRMDDNDPEQDADDAPEERSTVEPMLAIDPPSSRLPLRFVPRPASLKPSAPAEPSREFEEIVRLRRVLAETLDHLETLRSLLPH
jgi:DNA-binding transcriptional MerR regulator|nr:MerR family transcriptional regulator [Acidisoma sp. PAMC 29798]